METPDWKNKERIKIILDARPMLAAGEHPLERVKNEAGALNPGEIFEIITPFSPVPMIEKMGALGFETFSEKDEEGIFHTFFMKKEE